MTAIDMGLGNAVGVGIKVGVGITVRVGIRDGVKDGTGESVLTKTFGDAKEGAGGKPARGAESWHPKRKTINNKSSSDKLRRIALYARDYTPPCRATIKNL